MNLIKSYEFVSAFVRDIREQNLEAFDPYKK